MKPTLNRLLVRVRPEVIEKDGAVTGNSVMIADVLKVGPDVKNIKKDDVVMFSPYGFDEIMIDGEKLIVINEDLILLSEHEEK